jgi:hypothetical protein
VPQVRREQRPEALLVLMLNHRLLRLLVPRVQQQPARLERLAQ